MLKPSPGFSSYLSNNGDTARVLRTAAAGVYSVSATGQCDSYHTTAEVRVIHPPQAFSIGADTTICNGQELSLRAPDGYAYRWSSGSADQQIIVTDGGVYSVTVSNTCGSQTAALQVEVILTPQPPLVITGETDLCRSGAMQPVTLTALDNGLHLQWNTGATTPQITVTAPGSYILTAYNDCGSITDSVYVQGCSGITGFPTAFSPNGDGKNDVFLPMVQDMKLVTEYHLQVFNRWGLIVFESNNPAVGWDGRIKGSPAPIGTYFWQCRYKDAAGNEELKKGDITLVR